MQARTERLIKKMKDFPEPFPKNNIAFENINDLKGMIRCIFLHWTDYADDLLIKEVDLADLSFGKNRDSDTRLMRLAEGPYMNKKAIIMS